MMANGDVALGTSLVGRVRRMLSSQRRVLWPVLAAVVALVLFLSTLQVTVNGSGHPYATDVGEIQNALPRWGLIHRSGYPLYTAVGSLFVTVLRLVGIQPAAGASLFSSLWGIVFVALLVVLVQELGVSGPVAVLGALSVALSTAVWVNASLAEVHTLTLVFTVATLLFALRFGRTGERRDLLLLALFFTQGVSHQRSVILLAPAVAVLAWSQRRVFLRNLALVLAISSLALFVYLYMPFRVWTRATWVFGSPGTWDGFWEMVFDNRGGRVFALSADLDEWLMRLGVTWQILSEDMFWPLLVLGLVGVLLPVARGRWREGLGMTLAWIPNLWLTLVIWSDEVIDAQLAAKLPVVLMAGVGLALFLEWLGRRLRTLEWIAALAFIGVLIGWGWRVRPLVLSITRDPHAERIIAIAERVVPLPDERCTTLVVPWGHDYWALVYAQAYRGQLSDLNLVDHNVDLRAIAGEGRLLTLRGTFHVFPISWWEERLGPLYLSSAAPDVVEMGLVPPVNADDVPSDVGLDLGNGLAIRSTTLSWEGTFDRLLLTVYWEAVQPVENDYSVAVHLVAHDPPRGEEDVLAQSDAVHPVMGWYPTSQWVVGEVVRDDYVFSVPSDVPPIAVRVGMYRVDANGTFVNTEWLSLPIPKQTVRNLDVGTVLLYATYCKKDTFLHRKGENHAGTE